MKREKGRRERNDIAPRVMPGTKSGRDRAVPGLGAEMASFFSSVVSFAVSCGGGWTAATTVLSFDGA